MDHRYGSRFACSDPSINRDVRSANLGSCASWRVSRQGFLGSLTLDSRSERLAAGDLPAFGGRCLMMQQVRCCSLSFLH